jgi:hypothetical protein
MDAVDALTLAGKRANENGDLHSAQLFEGAAKEIARLRRKFINEGVFNSALRRTVGAMKERLGNYEAETTEWYGSATLTAAIMRREALVAMADVEIAFDRILDRLELESQRA